MNQRGASTGRRRLNRAALSLLASMLTPIAATAPALAAKIEVHSTADQSIIKVVGTLERQDGQVFADKVSGLSRGTVVLNSPGGNLMAGLRIGNVVQLKGFATIVPDGAGCASACAFAWLAGRVRYMGPEAVIGFHAAYRIENGRATETGAGNALVGAYLNRLGLSDSAIIYITSAPPSELNWLTVEDARRLDIAVTVLPAPSRGHERSDLPRPAPTPARPPEAGLRSRDAATLGDTARSFAASYFAHWSESNDDALRYFHTIYSGKVRFYDRQISRQVLLTEKRKFVERWPERIYTADSSSFKTTCDPETLRCTVTGRVGWDCRDPNRGATSVGLADFTLQIAISPEGAARIEGEWSKVVSP